MFDELEKYKQNDHFFLMSDGNLRKNCNAPTDKSGVYLIYALKNGRIEFVYIGRSGEHLPDGSMFVRATGLGGLKDRIINGHHLGKIPAHVSWPAQMKKEKIEALDIYWYVTHDDKYSDCPKKLRSELLQKHIDIFGRLPRWNSKL